MKLAAFISSNTTKGTTRMWYFFKDFTNSYGLSLMASIDESKRSRPRVCISTPLTEKRYTISTQFVYSTKTYKISCCSRLWSQCHTVVARARVCDPGDVVVSQPVYLAVAVEWFGHCGVPATPLCQALSHTHTQTYASALQFYLRLCGLYRNKNKIVKRKFYTKYWFPQPYSVFSKFVSAHTQAIIME